MIFSYAEDHVIFSLFSSFFNKIMIKREFTLRLKKTDTYSSIFIIYYSNDYASINANWNRQLVSVAIIFSTLVFYIIRSIQKFTWFCPWLHIFSNKILIEKEDLEKQYSPHYSNNYAGVDINLNR